MGKDKKKQIELEDITKHPEKNKEKKENTEYKGDKEYEEKGECERERGNEKNTKKIISVSNFSRISSNFRSRVPDPMLGSTCWDSMTSERGRERIVTSLSRYY